LVAPENALELDRLNPIVGDVDSCDSNKRIPTIKGDGVSSTT